MIRNYLKFLAHVFVRGFDGGPAFYAWMLILTVIAVIGGNAYMNQYVDGLAVTNMTDQVSWGAYIANFTFLVGVAAASVMLVIPAYIYRNEEMHDVVIYGELLAVAAIIMSLLFVIVDLGRPDRFWHMIPVIGVFHFPESMLAWDVIVLSGYLLLNLHICGYLLFTRYEQRRPTRLFYVPFVLLSIAWAVSIHTVTAFLYVGLVGRPFWNSAIVAPRFLASAFTVGPAILVLVFHTLSRLDFFDASSRAISLLRQIITASLLINLFMLGSEVFRELYSGSVHSASLKYLLFGLHGRDLLVPWFWSALSMELIAAMILIVPRFARKTGLFNAACVLSIIGIWIEKGMGLIVPGFIPSPMGSIVEYQPSWNEFLVCIGIWAFGILLYSWLLHLAVPIMTNTMTPRPVGHDA